MDQTTPPLEFGSEAPTAMPMAPTSDLGQPAPPAPSFADHIPPPSPDPLPTADVPAAGAVSGINLWADELPDSALPDPAVEPTIVRSTQATHVVGPASESNDPLANKIAELTQREAQIPPPAPADEETDPLAEMVNSAVSMAIARSRAR